MRMEILIVGAGGIGRKHVLSLLRMNNCNVHCFDLSKKILLELEKIHPEVKTYSALNNIVQIKFHGAIICTPTNTHIKYAYWCAERNIPFLVEKPLSVDEDGIEDLISLCQSANIPAGVAYPRRSGYPYQLMKRKIELGELGDLKLIRTNFSQDYRKYRPDYKDTYYSKLSSGGGIIMDALSHHINLLSYYGGGVESVSALSEKIVFQDVEGEDVAFVNIKFKNGVLGCINGNQFQKPNEDFIELVGTKGNIRFERISGYFYDFNCTNDSWERSELNGSWEDILMNQIANFLKSIARIEFFPTTLKEGQQDLKVLLAIRESIEHSKTIILK